ncbi:MAG: amidohydrolase [Leptospiraceae bacterium]|nr:amidohydrolase [Leptospiraceae bacterium]
MSFNMLSRDMALAWPRAAAFAARAVAGSLFSGGPERLLPPKRIERTPNQPTMALSIQAHELMGRTKVSELQALTPAMKQWRRQIHAHPETAFEERNTAALVADVLAEAGLQTTTGFARTGVVGVLKNGDGPSLGLRADLDALNLEERNDFQHRSRIPGKMHACGHDGHTAMLLGAARHLARTKRFRGTVNFIFQPAEENDGGGRLMVDEGLFEKFPCDAIFGLHNWPGLEAGRFAIQAGPVMAAYDNFDVEICGQGSHAAMPHQGIDPVVIAAQIIMALQTVVSRNDPLKPAVVSVTRVEAGFAYNVIPEKTTLRGTARSLFPETRDHIENSVRRIVKGICDSAGATASVTYRRSYPATINSERETAFAQQVVRATFGEEHLLTDYPPSMGSEDFAYMLEHKAGCYVKLGNGPGTGGCTLHNPRYDFNDEILSAGAAYWVALAEHYLPI